MPKDLTRYRSHALTPSSTTLTDRGRQELAVSAYDVLELPADRQVGWIDIPSLHLSMPAKGHLRIPRLPSVFTGTDLEQFSQSCRRVEFTPSLGSKGDFRFVQDFPPNAVTSLNVPPGFLPHFEAAREWLLPRFHCVVFAISQRNSAALDQLLTTLQTCPTLKCAVFLTADEGEGATVSLRYRDLRIRPLFNADLISWNKAPAYIFLSTASQHLFPHPNHIYVDSGHPGHPLEGSYSVTDIYYAELQPCYWERIGEKESPAYYGPVQENEGAESLKWILASHPNLRRLIFQGSIGTSEAWSLIADTSIEELIIDGTVPSLAEQTPFPPLLKTFSCYNDFSEEELEVLCSRGIRNLQFSSPDCIRGSHSVETILSTPGLTRLDIEIYDDVDFSDTPPLPSLNLTHLNIRTLFRWLSDGEGAGWLIDEKHGLRGFDLLNAVLSRTSIASLYVDDICLFAGEDEFDAPALRNLCALRALEVTIDTRYVDYEGIYGLLGYLDYMQCCKQLKALSLTLVDDIDGIDEEGIETFRESLREIVRLPSLRRLTLGYTSYDPRPIVDQNGQEFVRWDIERDHTDAIGFVDILASADSLCECQIAISTLDNRERILERINIDVSTLLDPSTLLARIARRLFG